MVIPRRAITFRQMPANTLGLKIQRRGRTLSTILLGLCFAMLGSSGCGQTAKPVTSSSASLVDSYFGGPFNVPGSNLAKSSSTFDHAAKQISVSAFINTQTAQVPTGIISGGFVIADTGFLKITENFATNSSGVITPQNPPLTGAWAVEIPGVGALANLLSINSTSTAASVRAAPAAMAENTACPDFSNPASFLYVTVPNAAKLSSDTANYGGVRFCHHFQDTAICHRIAAAVWFQRDGGLLSHQPWGADRLSLQFVRHGFQSRTG
jgi:hypothetical protein